MNRPIISVIVTAYNAEAWLDRCINSIINSTLKEIELILIDDGSTDRSLEIMKKYEEKDYRIIVRHISNGGPGHARNVGIDNVQGEYVTFVDADDCISTDILQKCSNIIKQYKPDLMDFNFYYVPEDGHSYPAKSNRIPKNRLLDREFLLQKIIPVIINVNGDMQYFIENYACMKVFKKEILDNKNVRFDENRRKGEDRLFNACFLKYSQTYWSLSDYGYYYIKTPNSLSVSFDKTALNSIIVNFETYAALFGDIYNFYNDYSIKYWCSSFINAIIEQYSFEIDDKVLKSMVEQALLSDTIKQWFDKFKPQNKFEKKIKEEILLKNCESVFKICFKESKKRKKKRKIIKKIDTIKQIYSGIKRRMRYYPIYYKKFFKY